MLERPNERDKIIAYLLSNTPGELAVAGEATALRLLISLAPLVVIFDLTVIRIAELTGVLPIVSMHREQQSREYIT